VTELIQAALTNLLSPMVLFFLLGFAAVKLGSDLAIPEPISKAISLYLMLSIGFRGGVELHHSGLSGQLVPTLLSASALSFFMPVLAYAGMKALGPVVDAPFRGVLAIFLLDMGLLTAHRLRTASRLGPRLLSFGIYMPLIGAAVGLAVARMLGMSLGSATLLTVLTASASYIAVPAAMRLALPEANPAVYTTLSLGITFPFNLSLGIPLYFASAERLFQP
jgi:hypothetical protein